MAGRKSAADGTKYGLERYSRPTLFEIMRKVFFGRYIRRGGAPEGENIQRGWYIFASFFPNKQGSRKKKEPKEKLEFRGSEKCKKPRRTCRAAIDQSSRSQQRRKLFLPAVELNGLGRLKEGVSRKETKGLFSLLNSAIPRK